MYVCLQIRLYVKHGGYSSRAVDMTMVHTIYVCMYVVCMYTNMYVYEYVYVYVHPLSGINQIIVYSLPILTSSKNLILMLQYFMNVSFRAPGHPGHWPYKIHGLPDHRIQTVTLTMIGPNLR